MQREKLKVEKRTIVGKKVKKLRREGLLPTNVYGKELKSEATQLPMKEFIEVFKKAHETGLVDLQLDGKTLPVLIHNVQFNPKTDEPVHADFFKVNLKEKIAANIPVIPVGEPAAVTEKVGILLHPLAEIEVEALPTDLPEKIEVNVEGLKAIDDQIAVEQIKVPAGVTILTEPSEVVFKIGELVTKETEELAAAEEAAAEEAAAEAAAEAGEAVEGEEKPAEEIGAEEKKEEQPEEKPQEA
ncbi:50S ribosomal protein L25 [Patescibacteria group bacterium]|nr:50S ribosomal protein L25 [Patescibacteria group bacterium]